MVANLNAVEVLKDTETGNIVQVATVKMDFAKSTFILITWANETVFVAQDPGEFGSVLNDRIYLPDLDANQPNTTGVGSEDFVNNLILIEVKKLEKYSDPKFVIVDIELPQPTE